MAFQFVGSGPSGPVVNQSVTKLSQSVQPFRPVSSGLSEAAAAIVQGLRVGQEKSEKNEARDKVIAAMEAAGADPVQIARAYKNPDGAAQMFGVERRKNAAYERDKSDTISAEQRRMQQAATVREQKHQEDLKRHALAGKDANYYLKLGVTQDPAQAAAYAADPRIGGMALKEHFARQRALASKDDRADAAIRVHAAKKQYEAGTQAVTSIDKGTASAQHTLQLYEMAAQSIEGGTGADVGIMAGAGDMLNRGLAALGYADPETLAKMDNYAKFEMLANRLALLAKGEQGQPGYLSGAMSDKDIEFLTKQTINKNYTRQQNMAIIRSQRYMLKHAVEVGKLKERVLESVGQDHREFNKVWGKRLREFNAAAGKTGFLAEAKLDVEITKRRGNAPVDQMDLATKQRFLEKIKAQDDAKRAARSQKAKETAKRVQNKRKIESGDRPLFTPNSPLDRGYNYFFGK